MTRTLAVSLLALVCSTALHAQAVIGSAAITGIVRDIYGDGIPDCTVTLTNKTVGVKRVLMTSDTGIFDATGLIPADAYDLKVTRRGYADWELPSFDLAVGETLNFKIPLFADKPSSPADALRALPAVQDNKTVLSAQVTEEQLNSLPSKDHLLDSFVLLAPAVTQSPDGVLVFRGEPWTNAFLFNGINTTNLFFLNHPGVAPFVTQESTSQMQVISAAAPAEFGRSAGGFMNTVSKTGVNGFHASAYDYYSKNSWDEPDFFANGFVPPGRLNRAGISAGLPVATDTLFLFGNLERVNDSSQGLNHITNPLFTNAAGTALNVTGCTATAAQCTAATNFISSEMNIRVPMTRSSTSGFVRMDFRPGEHNSFMAAASIYSQRGINGLNNALVAPNGGLYSANADTTNSTRFAQFGWTHAISGTAVNEFRGAWYRDSLTANTNPGQFPSTGPVAITLAGTPLGSNPTLPFNLREQRYGGSDIFTVTIGDHSIRLGGEVWRNQDTMSQLYALYGLYNYTSFSAFAEDFSANVKALKNYATFTQTLGTSLTDLFSWSFNVHAQDTWKVRPGLVITAGVRYEKERLPQPTQPNPANFDSEFIPSPNTNFSPRIGVAYMISKRTVFRVGGGTYYQPFSGQFVRDLFTGGGIYQSNYELVPNAVGAPVFRNTLPATATSTLNSNLVTQFYAAERFRNPYAIEGSAAIERRVNRWVSLAVAYTQSQAVKFWTMTDQNLPGGSTVTENYTINNAAGNPTGNTYSTLVWNPAPVGHRYQVDTEGASKYRGASAQLRTAPIFGLSVQASYTWSHAIDDISGPPAYSIVSSNTFPGAFNFDRGNATFDQRNRGEVNWVWAPVFTKNNGVLSRFLVNGWLVSGIGTYASSMYATPTVVVSGQQFTGVTMLYTTTLNATDGWGRVPFQAIGSLPIGAQTNIDVRISRALPFTSRLQGKLMLQAYNVTNHQNNSAVSTIAYQAVSGVLKPMPFLGAPIASYGYPFGTTARHIEVAFRLEF